MIKAFARIQAHAKMLDTERGPVQSKLNGEDLFGKE